MERGGKEGRKAGGNGGKRKGVEERTKQEKSTIERRRKGGRRGKRVGGNGGRRRGREERMKWKELEKEIRE